MLVIDASAVLELLMATPDGFAVENHVPASGEPLAAPHLIDVEVLQTPHPSRRLPDSDRSAGMSWSRSRR